MIPENVHPARTWSVAIPTYNASAFIAYALNSVLQQGYPEHEMEIIVLDNDSTDDTRDIVKAIGGDRVKLIHHANNIGMMENFNECIRQSTGKYVHILHADDAVLPGFYKEFRQAFEQYPDAGLVSCFVDLVDENCNKDTTLKLLPSVTMPNNDVSAFLYENPFRAPGVVVRKSAYNTVGEFDAELSYTADWDMWLRVISNCNGFYIHKSLCQYRRHTTSGTKDATKTGNNILDKERLFKKFNRLGYPIDMGKAMALLRKSAEISYRACVFAGDREPEQAMKKIYLRYTNRFMQQLMWLKVEVYLLLRAAGITELVKKMLGKK